MRQSHGVSASFPVRSRAGSATSDKKERRTACRFRRSKPPVDWIVVECIRVGARRLPKLPRRKETWRHRGYVCACTFSTRVRACMRACQWSRFAEEYVRLPRFFVRVTSAFSSFGSPPFFLRATRSPFSPFSVSLRACSSAILVTSARVHRVPDRSRAWFTPRNSSRLEALGSGLPGPQETAAFSWLAVV